MHSYLPFFFATLFHVQKPPNFSWKENITCTLFPITFLLLLIHFYLMGWAFLLLTFFLIYCHNFSFFLFPCFAMLYLQVFKSGEGKALSLKWDIREREQQFLYLLPIKYLLINTWCGKFSWLQGPFWPFQRHCSYEALNLNLENTSAK